MNIPLGALVTSPTPAARAQNAAGTAQPEGRFAAVMQDARAALRTATPLAETDGVATDAAASGAVKDAASPDAATDSAEEAQGAESRSFDPDLGAFLVAGAGPFGAVTIPSPSAKVPAAPLQPILPTALLPDALPPDALLPTALLPTAQVPAASAESMPATAAPAATSAPTAPVTAPGTMPESPKTSGLPTAQPNGGTSPASAPSVKLVTHAGQAPGPAGLISADRDAQAAAASVPAHATVAAAAIPADPGESAGAAPVFAVPPLAAPAAPPAAAAVPAAPAASAAPASPVPLTTQVSGPIFTLAGATSGEHVLTINVAPDNLGPVTVRAHVMGDNIRIELFAPTDVGRDALRAIMSDLRRDLAGSGMNASLDLSSQNQAADSSAARQGRSQQEARDAAGRQQADTNGEPPRARTSQPGMVNARLYETSSAIDVMA